MLKIVVVCIIAINILTAGVIFALHIGYNNQEIELRNLIGAQKATIEANFDKMWKVISQQANISTEYKKGFKDIYVSLMEGRYNNNHGQLMLWLKEANPQFESVLFSRLMNSIEGLRTEFFYEQKKLISYKQEHDNLLQKIPSRWFIDVEPIEIVILSSSNTKKVMETGKEDNISLFPSEK